MTSGLTFLVGGARSGKSALAVEIGVRHEAGRPTGPTFPSGVTFIATAPSRPENPDADLDERIARHRAERPAWPTVEAPTAIVDAVASAPGNDLVIVDCLTLWVSNLMLRGDEPDDITATAGTFAGLAASRPGPTVVVSNEVGLGVHPATELGRRYRDVLGQVNQRVANAAGVTLLMVAGRAVRLDDPARLLS